MLIQLVKSKIEEIQWIKDREVINGRVVRLNDAYPILDVDYEQKIQRLRAYLDTFSNLKITGRTGAFAYLSLHHIMESSSKIMTSYSREKDDEHILFPKISGTFV
jgi:protoporphyrinogen oxidase